MAIILWAGESTTEDDRRDECGEDEISFGGEKAALFDEVRDRTTKGGRDSLVGGDNASGHLLLDVQGEDIIFATGIESFEVSGKEQEVILEGSFEEMH